MNVHFVTPDNSFNGYGIAEQQIDKYLAKNGIILEKEYKGQDISLVLNLASSIVHAKGKIKILYTMIEGDTYPPEWVDLCKQATAVIVPNGWCKNVLKKAGIKSKVIPLGYDSEIFKPRRKETNTPYTFLHYEAFSNQGRKGWEDLLDAWMLSLSDNEGAKLILKTIQPWDKIPKRVKEFQNVEVISGKLPHEAMASLLHEADCFVFPSRGEGFSLPPLEAMGCCLPVILTKAHSHLSYFDDRFMYGIPIAKKIPAKYPWFDYPIGNFVRGDIELLGKMLEHVFENQEEAYRKGQQAGGYVQKFSMEESVKKLIKFLKRLDKC